MVKAVVDRLPDLPDEVFVSARQENLETIHQHNVIAERFGTIGEIRSELTTGLHVPRHTSLRAWLDRAG
jgi:GTP cyclohydrolase I/GTP cyclohydrolase-4